MKAPFIAIILSLALAGAAPAPDTEPAHNDTVNAVLDQLLLVIVDMRWAKQNRKGEQDWLLDELVEVERQLRELHAPLPDPDPASPE